MLKQSSSSKQSSISSVPVAPSGVVPGLMNPPMTRHSPQQDLGTGIMSAPGQGRNTLPQTRQTQYQPDMITVSTTWPQVVLKLPIS
jgi:hypothetical protein